MNKCGKLYRNPQDSWGWALEAPTGRGICTDLNLGTGRDKVGRANTGGHLILLSASLFDCHMKGREWGVN